MGLYAYVNLEDYGFETVLEGDMGGTPQTWDVDYSSAISAFCQTFIDIATQLVPVDTGYLQSTIDAYDISDVEAECITECEYAEYVEYGTYKQAAQPYFTPALEQAFNELLAAAQQIQVEAQEEFYAFLESMIDENDDGAAVQFSLLGAILGMMLLAPAMLMGMELKSIFTEDEQKAFGAMGSGLQVQII